MIGLDPVASSPLGAGISAPVDTDFAAPVLIVSRNGTTVTIDVENLGTRAVKIYRADNFRGNYSLIETVYPDDFPYNDTIGEEMNAKYKAAFTSINLTGRRSHSKYTVS